MDKQLIHEKTVHEQQSLRLTLSARDPVAGVSTLLCSLTWTGERLDLQGNKEMCAVIQQDFPDWKEVRTKETAEQLLARVMMAFRTQQMLEVRLDERVP